MSGAIFSSYISFEPKLSRISGHVLLCVQRSSNPLRGKATSKV